jgi:hypothetical protein
LYYIAQIKNITISAEGFINKRYFGVIV